MYQRLYFRYQKAPTGAPIKNVTDIRPDFEKVSTYVFRTR